MLINCILIGCIVAFILSALWLYHQEALDDAYQAGYDDAIKQMPDDDYYDAIIAESDYWFGTGGCRQWLDI